MTAFELVSTYPRFISTSLNAEQTLEQAGLHPSPLSLTLTLTLNP